MKSKGQSASEYIMTYGWAILVVVIVGIVIWQMGLFDIQSKSAPGLSGFSTLVPNDWAMVRSGGACTLSAQLYNAAGEGINSVRVSGGQPCVPGIVPPGDYTVCSKVFNDCVEAGKAYNKDLVVTYQRSSDNQTFQTAGKLWGNVEGS